MTADRAAVRRRTAAWREALTLPALLLLEVGAVLGLQRLGQVQALRIPWGDLGRELGPWFARSPVEYVLGAVVRQIALVTAWWLLASTILYLLAGLSRAPALIRGMARLTLPAVRRATDGAVAVALATSLLGASTSAAVAATTQAPPGRALTATTAAAQAGPTSTTRKEPAPPGYQPSPAETATTQPAPGAPSYQPSPAGTSTSTASTTSTTTTGATTTTTGATTTTAAASTTTAAPTTQAPTTQAPPTTTAAPTTTHPPSTTAASTTTPLPTSAPTTTTRAATTTTRTGSAAPAPSAPASTTPRPPGYVPGPAGTRPPATKPPPSTQPPAPAPSPPPAARPRLHRVAPGESLWSIARSNLANGTGRGEPEVRTREVAAYWLRMLAANRARLRSGNPDLIYPGEYVRLPAIKRSTGS